MTYVLVILMECILSCKTIASGYTGGRVGRGLVLDAVVTVNQPVQLLLSKIAFPNAGIRTWNVHQAIFWGTMASNVWS